MSDNLYPISDRLLKQSDRESLVGQSAKVIWMCGLSGSGKSTLATALEKKLFSQKRLVYVLDGDNIRTGLNSGLSFSDEDRRENIRRIAEVSKLFVDAGVISINSFITPNADLRKMARETIGKENLIEVYVKASFETCMKRDVKGLYAKADKGLVPLFTGKDSGFEEPPDSDLVIDTEAQSVEESLELLFQFVSPLIEI
ncbi:adenylyl-sulfate kinase [Candidatus Pelagisphaera phototrophica]|uniref:adenylyl-sulfate kinase n=1 Tax=Candidatus Pelagisphaera phototrophica TaxID=2684113 RepID=UPI001A010C1E|nr:adenylyl-sulfate kinase [Candidatus Pelagisphaera phototrophica]QXD30608.1 adenylyl-sulfate kinase [Candidatus Pelagisphaera phototrophica]